MMHPAETNFEKQVQGLIDRYGKLKFFQQALEKKDVTRHLINHAKHKNMHETLFFSLVSIGVIPLGIVGYLDFQPKELSFLIPVGIVMFCAVRAHSRKVKEALSELSKLAVGVHAKKLSKQ